MAVALFHIYVKRCPHSNFRRYVEKYQFYDDAAGDLFLKELKGTPLSSCATTKLRFP